MSLVTVTTLGRATRPGTMLMQLGQVRRTSGRTTDAPASEWPSYETTGEYLYSARIIADLVAKHHAGAYQYSRPDSVRMADGDIRQDQRFYEREYQQAAEILANRFPAGVAASEWYMFLRNKMGYRLVPAPFCSYGMEADPVTRKCVQKRVDVAPRGNGYEPTPGLEPKLPPIDENGRNAAAEAKFPVALVVGGAVAALLILRG